MNIPELLRPPYRRIVVESARPRQRVIEALRRATAAKQLLRTSRIGEPFEGVVGTEGFKIRNVILFYPNNSSILIGRFEPAANGARIIIVMRPRLENLILWLFLMTMLAVGAVLAILFGVFRNASALGAVPVLIFLMSLSYALFTIFFNREARRTIPPLVDILKNGYPPATPARTTP